MADAKLLDGKALSRRIEKELKAEIQAFSGRAPCLAVVIVGTHAPSLIYVGKKQEACKRVGIDSKLFEVEETVNKKELKKLIESINKDHDIDGILVQLPLPQQISPLEVAEWIHHDKDVDGFNPINMGKLLMGSLSGFIPCTPLGVKKLLDEHHISVTGKHVVVLGRSNIVGKPMAALLTQINPGYDATVTVLHRNSPDLKNICKSADILIIAAGQPHLITGSMVKKGAVVVDVGITKVNNVSLDRSKVVGDVCFDEVKKVADYITPVPGGVGPMTIAMLLENCVKSYKRHHKIL